MTHEDFEDTLLLAAPETGCWWNKKNKKGVFLERAVSPAPQGSLFGHAAFTALGIPGVSKAFKRPFKGLQSSKDKSKAL
jgi:hypothetical protein